MKPGRVGTLQIMTVREVAECLKVHTSTVYRLIRERQLPAFKIGSDYRFDQDAIEKWIVEQQLKSGSQR